MTVTVSISQLREELSAYIARVQRGDRVVVKDEKRGMEVAEIIQRKQFDPIAFRKAMYAAAGVLTAKNHPEWRTKKHIIAWLRRERKAADRHFDIPYPHVSR